MRATNSADTVNPSLADRQKEVVKAFVPKVRDILRKEFATQLDRLGLRPGGKHTPLEKMRLSRESINARRRVEALLGREAIAEHSPERAFRVVVQELAYTLLNRLMGLRAMETRALLYLPPPDDPTAPAEQTEVLTPVPGQAYSRFLRDLRAVGGDRYRYADDAEEALLHDGLVKSVPIYHG
jgi:hypothetical protein